MQTSIIPFSLGECPPFQPGNSKCCQVFIWQHLLPLHTLLEEAQRLKLPLPEYKHEKRLTEQASTLIMLAHLLGRYARLSHTPEGAPILTSHPHLHISISHTKGAYAVSLSPHRHGIDIERHSPRALRLRQRFLLPQEAHLHFSSATFSAEEEATILWCAKEAAFKAFSSPTLTRLEQVALEMENENQLLAHPADCPHLKVPISVHNNSELVTVICETVN